AKPIEPEAMFHTLQHWFPSKTGTPARRRRVTAGRSSEALELPVLPDLDTATGLRRVGGNRSLYRNLLGKFAISQTEVVTQIRAALADADRETAERLAHTLKGVAGNIGATPLQTLAADLEQALRQPADSSVQLEPLLMQTGQALEALINGLCAALATQRPSVTPVLSATKWDKLKPVLTHLKGLLNDSDAEAPDYLATHRVILAEALPIEPFLAIEKATTDYRFEEALQRLREVMQSTEDKEQA
ncbi:MAG: Hpt domain-containing protein, partial [Candidatus Competibacteraceae bacterium]|nr:Hpt domain-containing protein [Candidatus Competibacteraceae bacterium]